MKVSFVDLILCLYNKTNQMQDHPGPAQKLYSNVCYKYQCQVYSE
jgi:hypothetical protein